MKVITVRWFY